MSTLDSPNFQPQPYRPVALRYGLIGGLILVAISLVGQVAGLADPTQPYSAGSIINSILTYGTIIAILVLAVKFHRDSNQNGFITFGQAFGLGVLAALVMGVISAIYSYVFFAFIDPGFLDQVVEMQKEQMLESGMSESEVDQAFNMMSAMFTPGAFAIIAVVGSLIFGAIVSLIVAAVMKKDPPAAVTA